MVVSGSVSGVGMFVWKRMEGVRLVQWHPSARASLRRCGSGIWQ
jgi:hypothetical protein